MNRHARRLPGLALACLLALPSIVGGQEPTATLTLDEALTLARRNNPTFQARRNDEGAADWGVREAYGNWLPSAQASGGLQYQAAGEPRFGVFSGGDFGLSRTPEYYFSDYSLDLNWRLDGTTVFGVSQAKANARAAAAGVEAAGFDLDLAVTRQYLAVLRAQDGVALAKQEFDRAEENRKLAEARMTVGAAIAIDVKQAQVESGRSEVAVLRAENLVNTERLRLMEQLGVEIDRPVELVSRFDVFEPAWSKDDLVARAVAAHPQLLAFREQERASRAQLRTAKSAFLPSVNFNAGWNGFTRQAGSNQYLIDQARGQSLGRIANCEEINDLYSRLARPLPPEDCGQFVMTADDEAAIIAGNEVFPFDFSQQPASASLRISLPLFTGFSTRRQVELAEAAEADAKWVVRGEELRLKTEVATAYANVETARRAYVLEQRNRDLATEQLQLAQARYRVGAASFLELSEAETVKARADRAHLTALYDFHESVAALEAAVGARVRPQQ